MTNDFTRPGVMIYFDIRPAIQRLSVEERGELFTAVLDFAEHGVLPKLDGMVGMAFDLMRPKLERDAERYQEKRLKSIYAVYCREVEKRGEKPLSQTEWYQSVSTDTERYPTTTTTPTTASNTSPAADRAGIGEAKGAGKGAVEGIRGEARENPALSDDEFNKKRVAAITALLTRQ